MAEQTQTSMPARDAAVKEYADTGPESGLLEEEFDAALAGASPWTSERVSYPGRWVSRRRDRIYRRLLAAADLIALTLALALGVVVVDGAAPTALVLLAFPALVVVAKVLGLYDRDQHLLRKTTLEEIPALFHMSILAAFALWLLEGPLLEGSLTTLGVLTLWAALFAGMALTRALARRLASVLSPNERCAVIGSGPLAEELVSRLDASSGISVEFIGHLEPPSGVEAGATANGNGNGNGAGSRFGDLADFLVDNEIQRVVLAGSLGDHENLIPIVGEIKRIGVRISVLPSVSRAGGSSFEIERVNGITMLGIRGFEFNRSSRIVKRSIDLTLSGIALLVLAPLFLVVAIAIKLDSRGGVFYRQTRVGRHGEHFEMVKFRTMHDRAHERRQSLAHLNEAIGGLFKIENDPRVTRIGRPLRRLSIDELPQLWNVLRGDMSLVGPRPLVVEEDRLIKGWRRQRLAVTPGITGYWQVMGSARVPLDEMLKLDYLYVQNWSVWDDVKLILRTIPLIAGRRGM